MTVLVSIWLALILCVAAGLKAWRSERAAAGLATFGIAGVAAQRAGIWLLIGCELALAVLLAAGVGWAPTAAAGLFGLFTAVTSGALLAGRCALVVVGRGGGCQPHARHDERDQRHDQNLW